MGTRSREASDVRDERAVVGIAGWARRYGELLSQGVAGAGVAPLAQADELGRALADAAVPPAEIAAQHMRLVTELVSAGAAPAQEILAAVTPLYVRVTEAYCERFAEQARGLARNEQCFRELLESSRDVIYRVNLQDLSIEYLSPSVQELTGYSREELARMGRPGIVNSLIHPEDRPALELATRGDVSHAASSDGNFTLEFRLCHRDGAYRWCRVVRSVVRDAAGVPIARVGIVQDITERRKAEGELRLYRTGLERMIVERTGALAAVNNALQAELAERRRAGQLLLVQRDVGLALGCASELREVLTRVLEAACRIEGIAGGGVYLVDEATGHLELAVHTGLSPEFVAAGGHLDADNVKTRLVMAGQPIYLNQTTIQERHADILREGLCAVASIPIQQQGRVIAALNLGSRVETDFPPSTRQAIEAIAASVGAAVTRIRAEEALRSSEERYRLLADSMEDFVNLNDREGRRLYVSPSFYRVTGYTPEEIHATDFRTRVHPEDRARIEQARQHNLDGQPTRTEYRLVCKDGTYLWLEVQATPIRGSDGRVEKILCESRNITDRKRAEEALRGHEAILAAVAESAERLLRTQAWQDEVAALLRRLGEAAQVSRAYVFANQRAPDGTVLTSQRYEWAAPGISHQIDNPRNQNMPYLAAGFGRWLDALQRREPIHGNVATFPATERAVLADRGIRAQVVVPVFVGDEWWGFIGFADCVREREWALPEVEALKVAASTLGEAIYRQQAEEALRASEERFRTLATTAPVGIFLSDGSAGCLYVNSRLAEFCGLAPAECLGFGWLQTVHPEDREKVWAATQSALRAQQEFMLEFRLLRRDGQERWVHVHTAGVLSPDGALQMNVGIVEDTTARKHADEILRASEERYRLLAENTTDVIVRLSLEGTILYMSPACRVLTGFEPEEFVGHSMYEFFHDEDAEPMRGWHTRILQETAAQTFEYRVRCKDGSYVWCEATARARRDPVTGAALDIIRVVRNIAGRKTAEEAVRRHEEQMAHLARVSSLGEMISGLAHELAQPLSAILYFARGATAQAAGGKWDASEAITTLEKIAGQAERAGQFIHRLKTFVRKAAPDRVPTDLNVVVRDALRFVAPVARYHHVVIQLDLADNLPQVLVEKIQIEQVILNLVQNGLEAMGNLPITDRRLRVHTYSRANGAVCLEVSDSGPGLPPELAARVFDPFFTTKPTGTGLGLSISRTIIEDTHAGELWVKPNPGSGATFGFTLPAADRLGAEAAASE